MTMMQARLPIFALVWAATVVVSGAALSQPQTFAGKTVTLTIGYGPGSGNDIYGRLYISQTAPTEELLGKPGIQFKTAQFNWVGRIGSYNNITITWHTSKTRTIADALKNETTMGATGVGSAVYIYPNMMNKILGTKFKIVSGYQGTAQTSLAMERGEVEGVTMGWFPVKTNKASWLKEKKINFLVQFLTKRHPDLPNVPTIIEFARTDEEKQLFALFANDGEVGKTILTPPGVPAETVTTMRRAFDAMMKDKEFIADADKIQLETDSMTGEELQTMIAEVAKTPTAVVERAKSVLK
jgi:tripartite-type tricarboxylate transporter receptor subunit TctC